MPHNEFKIERKVGISRVTHTQKAEKYKPAATVTNSVLQCATNLSTHKCLTLVPKDGCVLPLISIRRIIPV